MIPLKLKVKNFLSYDEAIIDYSKISTTLVLGRNYDDPSSSNKSGKSTICVDALTWVLYGKHRASDSDEVSIDEIVRWGQDSCIVAFAFSLNDNVYKVMRSRNKKKGSSQLDFEIQNGTEWRSLNGNSIKETQQKIIDTLKLDYDVFINSVLFEQGSITSFASMKVSERKDVIRKILQLNQWDQYDDVARERLKEYKRKYEENGNVIITKTTLESQLREYQSALATNKGQILRQDVLCKTLSDAIKENRIIWQQHNVDTVKKKSLQADIERLTNAIGDIDIDINAAIENKEDYESQISENDGEVAVLKKQIQPVKDSSELDKLKGECQQELETIAATLVQIKTSVNMQIMQKNEMQYNINNIDELKTGVKCPTCFIEIQQGNKDIAKQHFKNEIAKLEGILNEQKAIYKENQVAQIAASKRMNLILKDIEAIQVAQSQQNQIAISLEHLEENKLLLIKRLNEIKQEIIVLQGNKEKHKVELQSKQFLFNQIPLDNKMLEVEKTIQDLEEQLTAQQSILTSCKVEEGRLEQSITSFTSELKRIESIVEEQFKLAKQISIYKELVLSFGRNGVQALIIENAAVEIEQIVTDILKRLSNGKMSVKIITQKQNKDKSIAETFDVIIYDEFGHCSFQMESGGGKQRVAFALRVALSKLLARRAGTEVKFLILDEATSNLDKAGIDEFVDILEVLQADFDKIMVITHQTEFKEHFESIIEVVKDQKGSRVIQK